MPRRSAPEPPLILSEAYNGVANTPYPDRYKNAIYFLKL